MKSKPKRTEQEQLAEAIRCDMPSRKELCEFAATLAGGRAFDRLEASAIAERAIHLWDACAQILRDTQAERVKGQTEARARLAALPKVRLPRKYPVKFTEFLRLAGGKGEADRLPLYRRYLAETGVGDVGAVVARQRAEGFAGQFDYYTNARDFLSWLRKHGDSNRRQRASAGGKATSAKRNAQKKS